jgi:curved DNA-binding protein CbpA
MVAIFKDYYYILGVSHFSSKSEINLAYKTLVREYHPDRNRQLTKEESTIKTALLNEAREYLNNDVLRKAYDTNYINRFNLRLPVKYQKLFDEE